MKYFSLYIILCFIFAAALFSQDYSYTKYDVASGLPQTQTVRVMQDSRNFLWVSTKNGVSRFDGKEFVNYGVADGLPDPQVAGLVETDNKIILAYGKSGISEYNGHNFDFAPIQEKYKQGTYLYSFNPYYRSFFISYSNHDTVYFLKYNNKQIEHYTTVIVRGGDEGIIKYGVSEPDNSLLLKHNDTIFLVNNPVDKKSSLTQIYTKPHVSVKIRNGNTYFHSGLSYYDYNKQVIIELSPPVEIENRIIEPIFRGKSGEGFFIQNEKYRSTLIWRNEHITGSILQDKDSVLWIASEGGLYKLETTAFVNFFPYHGLVKNVWSIVEGNNGEMYFASLGEGVQKYKDGKYSSVKQFAAIGETNFSHGSIRLSNGNMLFSGWSGIFEFDGEKLTRFPGDNKQAECIYENTDLNEIVFGCYDGVVRIKDNKREILYRPDNEKYPYIRGISYDARGYYWFVRESGIYRYDGVNSRTYPLDSIQLKYPICTDVDSSGNAWFGGLEGLFFYDEQTDRILPALPDKDNEVVKFVKVMDKDRLLVGRLKDLMIIDIHRFFQEREEAIQIINQVDGYLGIEPKQHGVRKDSKGFYWINCSNGVFRFDPRQLRSNPRPPDLYFTEIWVHNDTVDWVRHLAINNYDIAYEEPILLNHTQNYLRIYYTAISTYRQERIKYKYILSGGRKSWSVPQSENFVEFQELKPGKYTLQVHASNGDGVWTPEPKQISIYIKPAFWQTLLFRLMAALLMIILIVVVTTRINRKITDNRARQEAIVSDFNTMQMNQLIKQFDPHFTFNIINSIGALILSKETDKAYKYFTMLSRLLRSVLTNHTVLTRTLEEEIDFLEDYCSIQKYQLKERFEYEIEVQKPLNMEFRIPKLIIQNFVENSIKHGINPRPGGGKVWITISQIGRTIEIVVKDNGLGRKDAASRNIPGTKSGDRITKQLFSLIEKQTGKKVTYDVTDLYDKNNNPTGTEVLLRFPIDLKL